MLHPFTGAASVRFRLGMVATVLILGAARVGAQELEPRSYSVSPRGTNFVVLAFGRSSGDISFDPSLPVEDANATLHAMALGYARAIGFLGRSANVAVHVPYIWGTLDGLVDGSFQEARRSGLGNPAVRFAVNLHGAPAMDREQFREYRQKTIIGTSLVVSAPLGQYDPARVVNIGTNRWSAKPELGISQRVGRWYFDLYLGGWFYTPNRNFRGGVRRQDPIGSAQVHISCNVRRRLWAAFDANWYIGGRTSVNGLRYADLQRNSRVGGTLSLPLTTHQSLKFTGSTGAVTNIGAAFVSVGVAYQYLWGRGL
jgi:hypothetical protein